jgi:hypothetical protein
MKGIVFLTVESNISWREQTMLDENPYFMPDNYDLILKFWKFDTDDRDTMRTVFQAFKDLKLSQREVLDFAKSIGFEISTLRQ